MNTPYGWNLCLYYQWNPVDFWMAEQALDLLQPERWMSYGWVPQVNHPGFVPMIWTGPLSDLEIRSIQARMMAHPDGETWLFVNEGHLAEQANIEPVQAVDLMIQFINAAHEVGMPVNTCGPNAAINMPAQGIGRLSGAQWWREFMRALRRAGIVSPSMHGIHLYNSTDRAMVGHTWSKLIREWRRGWIGASPIIITEFCGENEPLEKQIEVMDEVFRLYQIGKMQGPVGEDGIMGAYWFAAFDMGPFWPNCALTEIDPDRTQTMRLTALGRHWLELKARL